MNKGIYRRVIWAHSLKGKRAITTMVGSIPASTRQGGQNTWVLTSQTTRKQQEHCGALKLQAFLQWFTSSSKVIPPKPFQTPSPMGTVYLNAQEYGGHLIQTNRVYSTAPTVSWLYRNAKFIQSNFKRSHSLAQSQNTVLKSKLQALFWDQGNFLTVMPCKIKKWIT